MDYGSVVYLVKYFPCQEENRVRIPADPRRPDDEHAKIVAYAKTDRRELERKSAHGGAGSGTFPRDCMGADKKSGHCSVPTIRLLGAHCRSSPT